MDFMPLEEATPHASGRLGHVVLGTIAAAALVLGGATLLARPSANSCADADAHHPGGSAGRRRGSPCRNGYRCRWAASELASGPRPRQ